MISQKKTRSLHLHVVLRSVSERSSNIADIQVGGYCSFRDPVAWMLIRFTLAPSPRLMVGVIHHEMRLPLYLLVQFPNSVAA